MKRITFVLSILLLLLSTAPLRAGEISPYVEVKAGGEYRQIDSIRNSSAVADPVPVNKTSVDDVVGVVGGAAGLDFKDIGLPVRTEIEYTYHSQMSYDANPTYINAHFPTTIKSDVNSHTLFLNAYYDIDTGTAFTPYVGGGIGWAWNRTKTTGTIIATGGSEKIKKTHNDFAWNLAAGCSYALTPNWAVDAGYRYIDFGKIIWGNENAQLTSKDITGHEVTLGLRYKF